MSPLHPAAEEVEAWGLISDPAGRLRPEPDARDDSHVPAPPSRLDLPGYRLLEEIHCGAMGEVYKARQESVDRVVAIKVLGSSFASEPEFVRRFWREALIAARLAHPHIVRIIDAGEVDGRPFLVMENVEGESVKERLDALEIVAEAEAIAIGRGVAEALAEADRRGLVHRDVKPANLLLTRDGGVKLADLGLARPVADERWALDEAGMAVGTPEYISPEQVRGQVDVDIRSDLYSLGCTLYHMVTGRVPYGGDTVAEAMRRHVDPRCSLIPPASLNPAVSNAFGAIIGKLMARNRDDRYARPDDLILDLDRLARGERPLLADLVADSLAALSEGDPAPPPRQAGSLPAEIEADPDADADGPLADGDDDWEPSLVIAPACLLASVMLVTVALLLVG